MSRASYLSIDNNLVLSKLRGLSRTFDTAGEFSNAAGQPENGQDALPGIE
jgi:hypothetical protein